MLVDEVEIVDVYVMIKPDWITLVTFKFPHSTPFASPDHNSFEVFMICMHVAIECNLAHHASL